MSNVASDKLITYPSIDLNGDVGEGSPTDREFIPLLTSANIACGGHAGDEQSMIETIEWVMEVGVQIGAHPGFMDREYFGRREIAVTADDVFNIVTEQLGRFILVASRSGAVMKHVKPHGALYHQTARDSQLAEALVRAVSAIDRRAAIVGPSGSALEKCARKAQLRFAREAFADRAYAPDGSLVPRTNPMALITDASQASQQAIQIVRENSVTAIDGGRVPMFADTICLHGDGTEAVCFARRLRSDLEAAAIRLRPFGGA